ncbi:UbiA family prenyltransferase [Histidinibacterium aquaticum]|uniref:UbiA family prenyltransferase n=1 Tax=Histidinibacterium aquaticum TaxID=2613962 RepID=A0A5J5GCC2_9RHOB|nr:UbiA family prenyltransferase [Histidinibacterium aquaticum]KAA9005084.1 UbiA family prenyltransferase [Histidinibacterium aquaticum]
MRRHCFRPPPRFRQESGELAKKIWRDAFCEWPTGRDGSGPLSGHRTSAAPGPLPAGNAGETIAKEPRLAGSGSIYPYLQVVRPHQWLKNVLVFLPLLAGHHFDLATFSESLLATVAFCLVASSAYVLNDLLDIEADRAHPRKRFRPFASGAIPTSHGRVLGGGLLLSGAAVAALLGGLFLLTLMAYFIVSAAYSLRLKRKVVVDICVLAGLYTFRIIGGGVASDIALSVWLLAFSIFFFFSLAAVKRQAELVDMLKRDELQAKGRGYRIEDLPIVCSAGLASGYVSVLVMALYLNSPAVLQLYGYPPALWGICCILLYWLTRMVFIAHRGAMHDDPVVFAAKDRASHVSVALIAGFALFGAMLPFSSP